MNLQSYIDATILRPDAKLSEFETLCQDANQYKFKAICVPPSMISFCKSKLSTSINLATVAGFPNGYQVLSTKLTEVNDLIQLGADEIDFVINRSLIANHQYDEIMEETKAWVSLCHNKNVCSKWIIEASTLNDEEIKNLCEIANEVKPSFVKTSTGVHGKATLENVKWMRKLLISSIQIKAAGGISDRKTATEFIEAGATRLGVSQYAHLIEV